VKNHPLFESQVHSMTGFSSVDGTVAGHRMRLEIKTLNHRFLDLKIRLPREFSSAELPFRAMLQTSILRGAVEVKLEKTSDGDAAAAQQVQANLPLAASYHEALLKIQKTLGLSESIRATEIASLPDVLIRANNEFQPEESWHNLKPLAKLAIDKLTEMRAHEGTALAKTLFEAIDELGTKLELLTNRRKDCEELFKQKNREKIAAILELHPIAEPGAIHTLLETRVAQELAILIERTDIQEELTRFRGHLDHFRKTLRTGGNVGRKLDFILQEMNREVNTLGNKAQDFLMGEEVVQIKVKLEQLREQVMNLE
jgi:uncharacterized protein (TIGR00255 family)